MIISKCTTQCGFLVLVPFCIMESREEDDDIFITQSPRVDKINSTLDAVDEIWKLINYQLQDMFQCDPPQQQTVASGKETGKNILKNNVRD